GASATSPPTSRASSRRSRPCSRCRPPTSPRGRLRTSTPCSGRDTVLTENAVEKSTSVLSQIFEPIRADLEKVDQEFARHVQSKVQLIPQIGQYIQTSGGKRIRPPGLVMAARVRGGRGGRARPVAAARAVLHA